MTKVSLYLKIPLKSIDFNFEKTSEICENRRISFSPFSQDLNTFDAKKKLCVCKNNNIIIGAVEEKQDVVMMIERVKKINLY